VCVFTRRKEAGSSQLEVPLKMDEMFDSVTSGLSVSLCDPGSESSEVSLTDMSEAGTSSGLDNLGGLTSCNKDFCQIDHNGPRGVENSGSSVRYGRGRGQCLQSLPVRKPRSNILNNFFGLSQNSDQLRDEESDLSEEPKYFKGSHKTAMPEALQKSSQDCRSPTAAGAENQVKPFQGLGRGLLLKLVPHGSKCEKARDSGIVCSASQTDSSHSCSPVGSVAVSSHSVDSELDCQYNSCQEETTVASSINTKKEGSELLVNFGKLQVEDVQKSDTASGGLKGVDLLNVKQRESLAGGALFRKESCEEDQISNCSYEDLITSPRGNVSCLKLPSKESLSQELVSNGSRISEQEYEEGFSREGSHDEGLKKGPEDLRNNGSRRDTSKASGAESVSSGHVTEKNKVHCSQEETTEGRNIACESTKESVDSPRNNALVKNTSEGSIIQHSLKRGGFGRGYGRGGVGRGQLLEHLRLSAAEGKTTRTETATGQGGEWSKKKPPERLMSCSSGNVGGVVCVFVLGEGVYGILQSFHQCAASI